MSAYATRQSRIVLAVVVAVAVSVVFILRDGFGWGDILGAVIIGVGVFIVLTVLRRFASR